MKGIFFIPTYCKFLKTKTLAASLHLYMPLPD